MARLKDEILSFYDYNVSENYAEKVLKYAEEKRTVFNWLFQGKQRINLKLSDEEAAHYFQDHDVLFSQLHTKTIEFLKKENDTSNQNISLAIFRNRIQYKKNVYKYSKFYRKNIDADFNFQSFYDRLKTAQCVISIHPMDFLSSSENASYTSCYAIDSCHHTGCTAYLGDPITIMAYTRMDNRKIGRQWIYIDDGYLIFGNIYGAISKPMQELIRSTIEEKYAKHLNTSNEWVIKHNYTIDEDQVENCGHADNVHEDYAIYFDLTVNAIARNKEMTTDFSKIFLEFYEGIDKDGYSTSEGTLAIDYCDICGARLNDDGTHTEDGMVCDYCLYHYYTFCSDCDEYFRDERHTIYYIEDEEKYVCEYCYNHGDYFFCEKTEVYWSNDKRVELIKEDGSIMSVSEEWAQENAYYCSCCERYYENYLADVDDEYLCDKCLTEYYDEIDGEYQPKQPQAA